MFFYPLHGAGGRAFVALSLDVVVVVAAAPSCFLSVQNNGARAHLYAIKDRTLFVTTTSLANVFLFCCSILKKNVFPSFPFFAAATGVSLKTKSSIPGSFASVVSSCTPVAPSLHLPAFGDQDGNARARLRPRGDVLALAQQKEAVGRRVLEHAPESDVLAVEPVAGGARDAAVLLLLRLADVFWLLGGCCCA